MTVTHKIVTKQDADQRLDKWFRQHFPGLPHTRLEKLLRTGQVRVDGKRAKAKDRITVDQKIRIPPLDHLLKLENSEKSKKTALSSKDVKFIRSLVIYEDDFVIVLNKPAGLAVQGGTKTRRHVDALLDGLEADGERPRLVHRLDKDTAGILVLARTREAAKFLMQQFQQKTVQKTYWAVCLGTPDSTQGEISLPLAKKQTRQGEKIKADPKGRDAVTRYKVRDAVPGFVLLELVPLTGRMHQLRVHCAENDMPIVGDGKYGGKPVKACMPQEFTGLLHLVAKGLKLPLPNGRTKSLTVPLPKHIQETLNHLGLNT